MKKLNVAQVVVLVLWVVCFFAPLLFDMASVKEYIVGYVLSEAVLTVIAVGIFRSLESK